MEPVKRSYQSPRRQAQAEATRRQILEAARELFVSKGYVATSIRAIARQAGVAEPTVYATFGSKRALLTALFEEMDMRAGMAELLADVRAAAGDPKKEIAAIVAFDRRLFERAADMINVVGQLPPNDPEFGELTREGRDRGRAGRTPLVQAWVETGRLREDMTVQEAVDAWIALGGPEVYRLLVDEGGWSPDHYQAWLTESLCRVLLNDDVGAGMS